MRSAFTEDYDVVVRLLIEARTQAGLTQQDVARKLGKPQSFVSKYERKERRLDVAEVISIAEAIGADPGDLLNSIHKTIRKSRRGK